MAALHEVAKPSPRTESQDTIDAVVDFPVSDGRSALRIWLTTSAWMARFDDTIRKKEYHGLSRGTVVGHMSDAGHASESSPKTKVLPVSHRIVHGPVVMSITARFISDRCREERTTMFGRTTCREKSATGTIVALALPFQWPDLWHMRWRITSS